MSFKHLHENNVLHDEHIGMLLIWDIHITAKWAEEILHQVETCIARYPDEESIIFVGDYVYHFNYDRKSLLRLFHLFIRLLESWKQVYVLAGNHDRIAWHFVYEEARQAFDLLQSTTTFAWSLHFITSPTRVTIDWKDILFFPYSFQVDTSTDILPDFEELATSQHRWEVLSAYANSILSHAVDEWRQSTHRTDRLYIIHHRYIQKTRFPGQQAMFSYKSPALDNAWLDEDDVLLISWHLHQPFSHKNYLCVWSVRHTSPLEVNQTKYLFRLTDQWVVEAIAVAINPYISISIDAETSTDITTTTYDNLLYERMSVLREEHEWLFLSSLRDVRFIYPDVDNPVHRTLVIESTTIGYDQLDSFFSDSFLQSFFDIRIKQPFRSLQEITERVSSASLELDKSISDWKILLKQYLTNKYGEEALEYEQILQELQVL